MNPCLRRWVTLDRSEPLPENRFLMTNMLKAALACIFLAFIISCGGGSSSPPPPPPPPPPPVFSHDTSKTPGLPIKLGKNGGNLPHFYTHNHKKTHNLCSG